MITKVKRNTSLTQALQQEFNRNGSGGLTIQREDGHADISMYPVGNETKAKLQLFLERLGLAVAGYGYACHERANADIEIGSNSSVSPLSRKGWDALCTLWDANRLDMNTQQYGCCAYHMSGRLVAPYGIVDNRNSQSGTSAKTWGTMRSGVMA